jgi:hypothetical protein
VLAADGGWRAARAYPARVWLPREAAPEIAEGLAAYGVPVEAAGP